MPSRLLRLVVLAVVLGILGVLLPACSTLGEAEVALLPDAVRTGADGADGPMGVARRSLLWQTRVEERVELELAYPARADGSLDATGGPFPVVVLVHGGLVPAPRYRWLANHLASRGMVVVSPGFLFDLALFTEDNARAALDAVMAETARDGSPLHGAARDGGPVAAMGHSLGGVVAADTFFNDHRVSALVLLAAYPSSGARIHDRPGFPVLSISGSADKKATPDSVKAGFDPLPAPRWLAFVDGMIHYDWTDGASSGELGGDGTPTRPQADTRRDALRLIDTFLDARLRNLAGPGALLEAGLFPGVTVSR